MKTGKEYKDPFMSDKVSDMVEKLRAAGHKKRPPTKIQAASTVANIERQANRHPDDDEVYWNRPLPPESEWRANADAEQVFKEQNKASFDDLMHARSTRQAAKNEIGQSEKSSVSEEKRDSAIHHFEVAGSLKATQVDPAKVTGITPIKSEPPPPIELKKKKTIKEYGWALIEKIKWGGK